MKGGIKLLVWLLVTSTLLASNAAANIIIPPPHDIAVVDIIAPSSVTQGDVVITTVVVENQGLADETVNVTLVDQTDGVAIGNKVVPVAAYNVSYVDFKWDTTDASIGDHEIYAVAWIPDDFDFSDNSMTKVITVTEPVISPVHDVAVVDIIAPLSVTQGDVATINVAVENQGNVDETGNVTLVDLTDHKFIGGKTFFVSASNFTYLSFSWDTSDASIGDHEIYAGAWLPEDIDWSDNSMTKVVTVTEPVIVIDGVISSLTTDKAYYQKQETVYTTAVVNNTGNAVLDAAVEFTYLKPDGSVAYTESKAISVGVGESAGVLSSYYLSKKGTPPGIRTVKAELVHDSNVLDTKTTTFEVVSKGKGKKLRR